MIVQNQNQSIYYSIIGLRFIGTKYQYFIGVSYDFGVSYNFEWTNVENIIIKYYLINYLIDEFERCLINRQIII